VSERNGSTTAPAVPRPDAAGQPETGPGTGATVTAQAAPQPGPPEGPQQAPQPVPEAPPSAPPSAPQPDPAAGAGDDDTAVPALSPARPTVRARRSGPLTRMGPWAPVAGGMVGVVLGLIGALVLAGSADDFRDRLALVFLVVGLGLLGASGTLLADEVRLVRWRARQAAISPGWVEATAGLLNGLTPARLLLLVSGFVLFLSAYVAVR
jgi:hypothetical protein